ncbi:MAG: hypothetical protein IJF03_12030 [Lachnospiraceae bacterium]|nr:hypothetical protein [Lachnospiraceae bacterium]
MIGLKIPVFEKGNVLTKEMLESMKAYAVDAIQLSYKDYGNGIISGCEITITDNILTIHKGLVYYQGNICFITENINLQYYPTDTWNVVKLVFGELSKELMFTTMEMYAEISERTEYEASAIEIARFRLQKGAVLRTEHRNFLDYETAYDTLNMIEAEYAGYKESTICPQLLYQFAEETKGCDLSNGMDMAFLLQIWNMKGQSLNRKVIENYIAMRLGKTVSHMTNREIYEGLVEVLKKIKHNKSEPQAPRRIPRMIID